MNKLKKGLIVILVLIYTIFLQVNIVNAFTVDELTGTQLQDQSATNFSNQIITVLTVAGASISVVVLIVLGLKYMMGSTSEKAEYKKTMIPYFIGAGFVFAASAIASVIFNVAVNLG